MSTSPFSPTRPAALLGALLLVIGLGLPGLLTSAGAPSAERAIAGSLKLTPSSVAPGATVVASGSIPPKHARSVKLQMKKAGHWKTIKSGSTNRRGRYQISFTAPSSSGNPVYRVLAPRTTIKHSLWPTVTTPARTLTVVIVTQVAMGDSHACALTATHDLWCWGMSNYGQLGDGGLVSGTPTHSAGPVQVIGTGYRQVSAGDTNTCAVRTDDSLWCWGNVTTLGHSGAFGDSSSPVQVPGTWKEVSVGGLTACAITKTGHQLWCWGAGLSGQLGQGNTSGSDVPVQVTGSWTTVSTGGEDYPNGGATCAIDTDGKAWCWGENGQGRLGTGDNTDATSPVAVDSTATWSSVTVGYMSSCGIETDGSASCWGYSADGELGNGTTLIHLSPYPVTVGGSTGWKQISMGLQHACGVQVDGNGWCWGWNQYGQIGNGTNVTTYYPDTIPSQLPGHWEWIEAGFESSAGAQASGALWAWGDDSHGELGDGGAAGESDSPMRIAGFG